MQATHTPTVHPTKTMQAQKHYTQAPARFILFTLAMVNDFWVLGSGFLI